MKEQMLVLRQYKDRLNKQQYMTFKGQILKGDIKGFRKGLFRLILKQYMNK